MRRTIESDGEDGVWMRVSVATPCPICGGESGCRTHAEEAFACCVQRPSDWRLSNGGWLHRVSSRSVDVVATALAPRAAAALAPRAESLLGEAALHGVAP